MSISPFWEITSLVFLGIDKVLFFFSFVQHEILLVESEESSYRFCVINLRFWLLINNVKKGEEVNNFFFVEIIIAWMMWSLILHAFVVSLRRMMSWRWWTWTRTGMRLFILFLGTGTIAEMNHFIIIWNLSLNLISTYRDRDFPFDLSEAWLALLFLSLLEALLPLRFESRVRERDFSE